MHHGFPIDVGGLGGANGSFVGVGPLDIEGQYPEQSLELWNTAWQRAAQQALEDRILVFFLDLAATGDTGR